MCEHGPGFPMGTGTERSGARDSCGNVFMSKAESTAGTILDDGWTRQKDEFCGKEELK